MRTLIVLSGLILVCGCQWPVDDDDVGADDDTGADDDDAADDDDTTPPADICDDYPGEVICEGDTAVTCDGAGDIVSQELCDTANGFECWWGTGCMKCYPGTTWCEDNVVVGCSSDGQNDYVVEICDEGAGQVCSGGSCITLCDQAEQQRSSIGCKFFGVDMWQISGTLPYAIVASNVNDTLVASVTVETRSGGTWSVQSSSTVDPQQLAIFQLPNRETSGTNISVGGAYRVTSNIPIIAYQFNPLQNASMTSDASLLIPASALDEMYLATAWGSENGQSEIDIVADVDGTQVWVTPTVATSAGGGVPAGSPGVQFGPITLDEGSVLQVASAAAGQSLEGTIVEASERVAVFGGHYCANVPPGTYACDHVEEQVFGLQTWGDEYTGARLPARATDPELSLWRFLAGDAPVSLHFEADASVTGLPPGNSLVLSAGESYELRIEGDATNPGDFYVTGDDAFLVTQFMAGQDIAAGVSNGDPCMVQAVPNEQYLDNYVVLVPTSWQNDYLTLTRAPGTTIIVDGTDVDTWPQWRQITSVNADWEVVRILVADGSHVLSGSADFGVIVSGVDAYDSYCYPGGLDQQIINDL